ncbi:MAG: PDC sensor domain-containing protein [Gammaproteobacteria bacterium]|nr:PDC sensor domain-containing protein [Gammaproteobacteria bacterium]
MSSLSQIIETQQQSINHYLQKNIQLMADSIIYLLDGPADTLNQVLLQTVKKIPDCKTQAIYIANENGVQISANIINKEIDDSFRGQSLVARPYFKEINLQADFFISEIYIDHNIKRPYLTAVKRLYHSEIGTHYLIADFDLVNLPINTMLTEPMLQWRQIKGDPSIRKTLFQQTRVTSAMDLELEKVMSVMENLIVERGIFHAKLHFSSSRATLWDIRDPLCYKLHVLDEIINPTVCLAYSNYLYPKGTLVDTNKIRPVLERFIQLRFADDTIYLRSASINIMNGLIGLNFSCDGSHYMPVDEFLARDMDFWFGDAC